MQLFYLPSLLLILAHINNATSAERLPDDSTQINPEFSILWQSPGKTRPDSPALAIRKTKEIKFLGVGSNMLPSSSYQHHGEKGLSNEKFPVEIEFGASGDKYAVKKIEPDHGLVRLYSDLWQPWSNDNTVLGQKLKKHITADRAEIHLSKLFGSSQPLAIKEGDSLWLGYSLYFTHLDYGCRTTTLQFLHTKGTGPSTGLVLLPQNGNLYFQVQQRSGPANANKNLGATWQLVTKKTSHTKILVKPKKWYSIIAHIKYAKNGTGSFKLWIFDEESKNRTSPLHNLVYSRNGNSMYSTDPKKDNHYQIRLGQYRWCRKPPNTPSKFTDRYLNMYLGPIRLHRSDSNEGFHLVNPASFANK